MLDKIDINNVSLIDNFNGIEIYKIENKLIKTNRINVFFIDKLNEENVSKNTLISYILKNSSMIYNSQRSIKTFLEENYGAYFDVEISKVGDFQIINFFIDYISEKFVPDNYNIQNKITNFILEIILNPLIFNEKFNCNVFNIERKNIVDILYSFKNDKAQYSISNCLNLLSKDYKINEFGSDKILENINPKDLYFYYKEYFIKKIPIKIFFTGETNSKITNLVKNKFFSIARENDFIKDFKSKFIENFNPIVNRKIEISDVSQVKLTLGYYTNIKPTDNKIFSLMLYNNILGYGMNSKLFKSVREKRGLVYDIFSALDVYKGTLIISCGLDADDSDKVIKEINHQIERMKKGLIKSSELISAKKFLVTNYLYQKDYPSNTISFFLDTLFSGVDYNIDTYINKINNVGKEDIIECSKNIHLGAIYIIKKG
jgi:predicted Zn-dependent peptidase